MSACSMTFCFITSLLLPMCMTLSFIHLLHASQLFMPYSCPPSASVFRSVFVICFTVNAFVTCCVIVVYFCDYVWILACFYYFCCIVLKSLQHYLKHMLWICVCYDIWIIVCFYVQTYSINQRSYMVVTNWNGWCIVCVRVLSALLLCGKK